MIWLAALGFMGFVVAYVWVGRIRVWAEQRRLLDIPNERSSHAVPTPKGGGLAIAAVSLTGLVLLRCVISGWAWKSVVGYALGAVCIFSISWLDDLRTVSNRVRFAVHCVGAGLLVTCCGDWSAVSVPFLGLTDLGPFGLLLAFFWTVGLTNAYNFMDGIDGIAGAQAVVAGLGWAFFGWWASDMQDMQLAASLGILLASSSLGFLVHNWPPARIFMGDVGSAFLGYSFAFLAVIGTEKRPGMFLVGILLVWPFVFDTLFTFIRRLMKRENVFAAHRSHLYQRLTISGFSHRTVTLIYTGLDMLGLVLAVLVTKNETWADLILLIVLPLACLGLWGLTVLRERHLAPGLRIKTYQ